MRRRASGDSAGCTCVMRRPRFGFATTKGACSSSASEMTHAISFPIQAASPIALFEPLPDDSDELTVEVACVCFEDHRPSLDVDLPVETPIETGVGEYPM